MLEQRIFKPESTKLNFRNLDVADDVSRILTGMPIVFGQVSRQIAENGKVYQEIIHSGALDNIIGNEDALRDVVLNINHNDDKLLARCSAKTLTLRKSKDGIQMSAFLGNTTLADDTIDDIERGNLSAMSFTFAVKESDVKWKRDNGKLFRHIYKIDKLVDVSLVARSAYKTKVEVSERGYQIAGNYYNETQKVETAGHEIYAFARNKDAKREFITIRDDGSCSNPDGFVARAPIDGTVDGNQAVIGKDINSLSINGLYPFLKQMGVDVQKGKKYPYTLPYQNPEIGEKLQELQVVTKSILTPHGQLITPQRYSTQRDYTVETFFSTEPQAFDEMLLELLAANYRKILQDAYQKALILAQTVAVDDLTKASLDALQQKIDISSPDSVPAFLVHHDTFFSLKNTPLSTGSGDRYLVEQYSKSVVSNGELYDGTDIWYSRLFEPESTGSRYLLFGNNREISVGFFDNPIEIVVDKYSRAGEGVITITMNVVAGVGIKNPFAFSKSNEIV